MTPPYDFAVYVDSSTPEKKVPWLKVGVGFWHKDQEGISLTLQALPFNGGRLILRTWADEQKKREKLRAQRDSSPGEDVDF